MLEPTPRPSTPRLTNNIAALGVVQLASYGIPLITLPYLTRVLGPTAYGEVVFTQALMVYFILLTDYGFSWSATRKIAAHRDDRAYISRVFIGTWTAQWILVLVAALLATVTVLCTDRLRPDATLYAVAFSAVLGNALFPIWFLQGLERLQAVAAIQVTTKLMAVFPVFVLVNKPSDAALVLAVNGGAAVLAGFLSIAWIRSQNLLDWHWAGVSAALQELRQGRALFGSRVVISFYTALIPLVLGWIAGPVAVAHFSIADKLRSAAQAVLTPLSQALFPRMSHLYANNAQAAVGLLKRSALAVLVISGTVSLLLWQLSDWLVLILAGREFDQAAAVLRWIAALPLIIGFSNLLGVQIMLPQRLTLPFNLILTTAGMTSLIILWPLVHSAHEVGAAQTLLITESLVTVSMMVFLQRHGYLSFIQKKHDDT